MTPVFFHWRRRHGNTTQGDQDDIAYPLIFFSIDNFDEAFEDVAVVAGQTVCVELVASLGENIRTAVFSGAVDHQQLAASYNARKTGRSWISRRTARRRTLEFLHMRGPKGLGQAQMAVSIAASATSPTASMVDQAGGGLVSYVRRISRSPISSLKSLLARTEAQDANLCQLNSFLTFVSLSWETLVECLLDRPTRPSFDIVDGLTRSDGRATANSAVHPPPAQGKVNAS